MYIRVYADLADESDDIFADVQFDSTLIADSLINQGYPQSWDNESVQRIGIMSNGQLDVFKRSQFDAISLSRTKLLFGTTFNYAVYFVDDQERVLNIGTCTSGHSSLAVSNYSDKYCDNISIDGLDTKHIVITERFVPHNGTFVRMVVYTWA